MNSKIWNAVISYTLFLLFSMFTVGLFVELEKKYHETDKS